MNRRTGPVARPAASSVQQARYTAEVIEPPQPLGQETPLPPAVQRQGAAQWAGPARDFDGMGPMAVHEGFAGDCNTCDVGPACGIPCGPPVCGSPLWFRGEYLMWWNKSARLPPLVTTSPTGTAQAQAGVLDEDDTTILFGGQNADSGIHPGGRFTLSYFPAACEDTGIEATYTFLGQESADFNGASVNGDPILARPFFNVDTSLQDALLVAFPNVAQTSRINVSLANQFQAFDLVSRQLFLEEPGRRVDVLLGYRYARFAERLAVDQVFTAGRAAQDIQEGTIVQASDVFAAGNEFHGAQLGVLTQRRCYRWSFEGLAKVALGGTRSRVTVNGTTITTVPGDTPVANQGALLAQPTNIGRYARETFSAIPEVGLTVGFDVTPRMKATFGYSLLYWSQVARPGDQIDVGTVAGSSTPHMNVNPTQFSGGTLTGVPAPLFRFVTTDYWAQGLNFGLDCRF